MPHRDDWVAAGADVKPGVGQQAAEALRVVVQLCAQRSAFRLQYLKDLRRTVRVWLSVGWLVGWVVGRLAVGGWVVTVGEEAARRPPVSRSWWCGRVGVGGCGATADSRIFKDKAHGRHCAG
eukprot:125696-Chlamydomonas_euryale.AAC.1